MRRTAWIVLTGALLAVQASGAKAEDRPVRPCIQDQPVYLKMASEACSPGFHEPPDPKKTIAPIEESDPRSPFTRIRSCDGRTAIDAAMEIARDPESLKDPERFFAVAWVLYVHNRKDEAVYWYEIGKIRSRSLWFVPEGPVPSDGHADETTMGGPIWNHGSLDVPRLIETMGRAEAWDRDHANPVLQRITDPSARKRLSSQDPYRQTLKDMLAKEPAVWQERARVNEALYRDTRSPDNGPYCGKGHYRRALVRRQVAWEVEQALVMLSTDPKVRAEVGSISAVFPSKTRNERDRDFPASYEFSVVGERSISPIVTVDHAGGKARITITCLSSKDSRCEGPSAPPLR